MHDNEKDNNNNNNNPTRYLTPALPQAELPENGFANQFVFLDYFSPSFWLFEIAKELSGVDIMAELVSPLAGQWAQVSAYGDALNKLSLCVGEVSATITADAKALQPHWQGNAANAAYRYFDTAAASLTAHSTILKDAHSDYRQLSLEMWKNCEAMEDVVQVMLDEALLAAIFAAAGTATLKTGVGAVIGYGLAAKHTFDLVQTFHRAILIVHAAKGMIDSFIHSTAILSRQMTDISSAATVSAPYDHPAVN